MDKSDKLKKVIVKQKKKKESSVEIPFGTEKELLNIEKKVGLVNARNALEVAKKGFRRIERPSIVLDEDVYTEAISKIIRRDYFPDINEMKLKCALLDAQKSGEILSIRRAQVNLENEMKKRKGLIGNDNERDEYFLNANSCQKVDTSLDLDSFLATYTSEDNASFNDILDKNALIRKVEYVLMHSKNKQMIKSIGSDEKREKLNLIEGDQDNILTSNSLMFTPNDDYSNKQVFAKKEVLNRENTRFIDKEYEKSGFNRESETGVSIKDVLRRSGSGNYVSNEYEEPTVAGYGFVDKDDYDYNDKKSYTIPAKSKREILHTNLVNKNKIKKMKENKLKSLVTRDNKRVTLTPAAQRILSSIRSGARKQL